jgi:hypothetical protein
LISQSPPRISIVALAILMLALAPLATPAEGVQYSAGSHVQGRIGSHWDRCTVIRPDVHGGYLLRCDSLPPSQESIFAESDVRSMQGNDEAPKRAEQTTARVAINAPAAAAESNAFKSTGPRVGVYGCMNQDAMEVVGLQFGLLNGNTYSTFDGGRGRYSYSRATGILTFTSGPFAGMRRSRETELAFRIMDEHGASTAFMCPWTPKNPASRHW